MDDTETRITEELRGIILHIEARTGLKSRWNGVFELLPLDANCRGLKPFSCSIALRADHAQRATRWRTLIHEALHAFSAGYNQADFTRNVGWEEGVVEQLQRLLRPHILRAMKVDVDESAFLLVEQAHPFNVYIQQLQQLAQAFNAEEEQICCNLLTVPIKQRYQHLFEQAMRQNNRAALYVLSTARPVMESTRHDTIANNY